MNIMSGMCRDFVVSHLRSQIKRLHCILSDFEQENAIDYEYANGSIKEVEGKLRQIRKLCAVNN